MTEGDPAAEALANVHDPLAAVLERPQDKGRCLPPADMELTEESGPVPEGRAALFQRAVKTGGEFSGATPAGEFSGLRTPESPPAHNTSRPAGWRQAGSCDSNARPPEPDQD
ncbi:MAG: hypothetical protein BroJett003_10970 [Planctomycetota bacterium]|nr:MAG: hypothetical protein BroJett003_10970 [Planctomycetota bacterium]